MASKYEEPTTPDNSIMQTEIVNEDLLKLMSLSGVDMDPAVFTIVTNLLRNGVSPNAILQFFSQAARYSKLGRLLRKKTSRKSSSRSTHHGSTTSSLAQRTADSGSEKQL